MAGFRNDSDIVQPSTKATVSEEMSQNDLSNLPPHHTKSTAPTMRLLLWFLLLLALNCPTPLNKSKVTVLLRAKGDKCWALWPNMSKYDLCFRSWKAVANETRLRDRWLSDETWYRELKHAFPDLMSQDFDRGKMNSALGLKDGNNLDDFDTNTTGRYRRSVTMLDPHGETHADTGKVKRRKVTFYFVTDPGRPVQRPPEGDTSFAALAGDFEIHASRRRAATRPEDMRAIDEEVRRKTSQEEAEPQESLPRQEETYFDSRSKEIVS